MSLPLIVVVGLVLLVGSRTEPYMAPFGLLLVGVGVLGCVQLVLERRWERARPGPALSRDYSGAPSTLLVRAPWSAALRWAITVTLAVPIALLALLTVLDAQWVWGAVLLAALAYLLVKSTPRGPSPGVHLTPDHLVLDDHGRERVLAWTELDSVVPRARTFLRLRDGSRAHFVAADLAVHPFLACLAIHRCIKDPAVRAELGTADSLTWPVWDGSG